MAKMAQDENGNVVLVTERDDELVRGFSERTGKTINVTSPLSKTEDEQTITLGLDDDALALDFTTKSEFDTFKLYVQDPNTGLIKRISDNETAIEEIERNYADTRAKETFKDEITFEKAIRVDDGINAGTSNSKIISSNGTISSLLGFWNTTNPIISTTELDFNVEGWETYLPNIKSTKKYVTDEIAKIPAGDVTLAGNNAFTGTNTFPQVVLSSSATLPQHPVRKREYDREVVKKTGDSTINGVLTASNLKTPFTANDDDDVVNNLTMQHFIDTKEQTFDVNYLMKDSDVQNVISETTFKNVKADREIGYTYTDDDFLTKGEIQSQNMTVTGTRRYENDLTLSGNTRKVIGTGVLQMEAPYEVRLVSTNSNIVLNSSGPNKNVNCRIPIDMNNKKITNMAAPTADNDAVTLKYFNDNKGSGGGLQIKTWTGETNTWGILQSLPTPVYNGMINVRPENGSSDKLVTFAKDRQQAYVFYLQGGDQPYASGNIIVTYVE